MSSIKRLPTPKINMLVEIRRNSDGLIANAVWKDWDFNTYWWTTGNASCDCNRSDFFYQIIGDENAPESICSEGRFSVRLSSNETKEILYDEFGTTP